MNFNEKIQKIQEELTAPKNQYNAFGKYKYRSLEDILEAVKPLLKECGLGIVFSDTIVLIGDRYYVKATVEIADTSGEKHNRMSCWAYAREPLVQKGMNESQITGSASSYARKYAVNGLFAIDDNKDADSQKKNGNGEKTTPQEKVNEIVEQAFFEYTTENKAELTEGFAYDKDKFIKAIVKHFKKLPTRKDSIKKILTDVKPKEVMVKVQPELIDAA